VPPTWTVPARGGHVTVRVTDFDERSAPQISARDHLGRFLVLLDRGTTCRVRVTTMNGELLGHLPVEWSHVIERELARCQGRGVAAVARAALCGRRDEHDLYVLLAWPRRRP